MKPPWDLLTTRECSHAKTRSISLLFAVLASFTLAAADVATLQGELVGIGAAEAQAIVAYREERGSFVSVDELLEVKGIGEALEKNCDKLS